MTRLRFFFVRAVEVRLNRDSGKITSPPGFAGRRHFSRNIGIRTLVPWGVLPTGTSQCAERPRHTGRPVAGYKGKINCDMSGNAYDWAEAPLGEPCRLVNGKAFEP